MAHWRALDGGFSVGRFCLQLHGWEQTRRFVVVRKREPERRSRKGSKPMDVPGYSFRIFVTTRADAEEEIWRDDNRRADMENRIAELKHDLAADCFCLKQFFAAEAALQTILLLAESQHVAGLPGYREPATLRTLVFARGAILRRAGRRVVLYLSQSRDGLKTRNPLIDSIFQCEVPTSTHWESRRRLDSLPPPRTSSTNQKLCSITKIRNRPLQNKS